MKKEEDETLFELDDLDDMDSEDVIEEIIDDENPMGSSNTTENSLVQQGEGSANTVKTAGLVAILGLLGWFIASRLKNDKSELTGEGDKNFKPVNFGF
jgi:hypothetical protein